MRFNISDLVTDRQYYGDKQFDITLTHRLSGLTMYVNSQMFKLYEEAYSYALNRLVIMVNNYDTAKEH